MASPIHAVSGRSFLPVAAALLLSSGVARAQEVVVPAREVEVATTPDRPQEAGGESRYAIDRTTLYGDDARIPLPMVIVATTSFSYANTGGDPLQATGTGGVNKSPTCGGTVAGHCYSGFSGNTAQPGGTMIVTGELGLFPHISVLGNVMVGLDPGAQGGVPPPVDVGGTAALRVGVFPLSWTHLHGVVSVGYIREAYNPPAYNDDATPSYWIPGQPGGVNAGYFQLAMTGDAGRFRFNGMFHGQHTFADARDPLDITVDLNASVRVVGKFRAGLEYVGQDLEESFSPGAEGGPRHFLGPVASIQLYNDRLTLIGGPAIGLSYISPDFVARVAASVGF
jgi:hypothetical protein